MNSDQMAFCIVSAAIAGLSLPVQAETGTDTNTNSATAAGGKTEWAKKGTSEDKKQISTKEAKSNLDTTQAVNRIVNVKPQALQPPAAEQPIRGFHPIKRLMQPIVQL